VFAFEEEWEYREESLVPVDRKGKEKNVNQSPIRGRQANSPSKVLEDHTAVVKRGEGSWGGRGIPYNTQAEKIKSRDVSLKGLAQR